MVITVAVIHLVVISTVAFLVYRRQEFFRALFWPALVLKLLAGVCLGLLYTHYYSSADTFAYLRDASELASLARVDISRYLGFLFGINEESGMALAMNEPRALFYTRIVSIFALITNDNYWAVGFYFSLFSFLTSWWLVQVICRNIPTASLPAAVAFLLLPSVVFWTSGVLKESLAMASLFFLTFLFLKVWFEEKLGWYQIVGCLLALWILWELKYYYAGVYIPIAVATLLYTILRRRLRTSVRTQLFIWVALFILGVIAITTLHPNFRVSRLLNVVVENNEAYNAISAPDNVVHFHNLQASPGSFLLNAPWALISGLFRPFISEATSVLHLFAAVENSVLLICFLASLTQVSRLRNTSLRTLVVAAAVYVVLLAVFLTLSAPNLGTLSRYRVGYLPFFALLVLCPNPVFRYVERCSTRL